jgi:hypothetical protein
MFSPIIRSNCLYLQYLLGSLREGDHWGDPGVDGRIILGWIFEKWVVGVWTGWS